MEWESILREWLWELREEWKERVKAVDCVFEHCFIFFSDIKESHEFHVSAKKIVMMLRGTKTTYIPDFISFTYFHNNHKMIPSTKLKF